jgi:hypothetical protein
VKGVRCEKGELSEGTSLKSSVTHSSATLFRLRLFRRRLSEKQRQLLERS